MRAALLMVSVLAACFTAAEDWPMSGGNVQRTGVSASKLPDKPQLLWSFKAKDAFKGSPVIAGGVVFAGSDDNKVYALKLGDGSKLWEFEATSHIEATPLVQDGVVYIGSDDCNLYALEAATGKLKWKYPTAGQIRAEPTVVKDKVLVGSWDQSLHCVEAATGKPLWTVATENYVNAPCSVAGDKVLFGGCDGFLYVVDIENGKVDAKVPVGAVRNGKPSDTAYIATSAAVKDNTAYIGHHEAEFLAIDLEKLQVKWRYKNPREFPFFSAPAILDDKVVAGSGDKYLHCFNAADGKTLWEFQTRGKIESGPVICGDRVVFGSNSGHVFIVSLKDGKELWSYEDSGEFSPSPAVTDGVFVIGSTSGTLFAFGSKK